jgi:hypothetical protein
MWGQRTEKDKKEDRARLYPKTFKEKFSLAIVLVFSVICFVLFKWFFYGSNVLPISADWQEFKNGFIVLAIFSMGLVWFFYPSMCKRVLRSFFSTEVRFTKSTRQWMLEDFWNLRRFSRKDIPVFLAVLFLIVIAFWLTAIYIN